MSPAEKFYTYTFQAQFYSCTPVPDHPHMREHSFYIYARDLPYDVPHGCNPRHQNINRPAYAPVKDSFLDTQKKIFHLQNRGITVLADRVDVQRVGDSSNEWIIMKAFIPDDLGNVDGQHSYLIVSELRGKNEAQRIKVRILELLPREHITDVAEGLNTSVQVTKDSLSNQRGRFEAIKTAIADKPYKDRIAWVENQEKTNMPVKQIIQLMWVCHPGLFDGATEKHPSWIYSRSVAVYENGFHRHEPLRNQLLTMAPAIPRLLDLLIYINDKTPDMALGARKKSRSRFKSITGETSTEAGIKDLCVRAEKKPLVPIEEKKMYDKLRDPYLMMIMSGFRAMLRIGDSGLVEWALPEQDIYRIFDSVHAKLLRRIIKQFKFDKQNHDVTSRQPSLWDGVEAEMRSAVASHRALGSVTPLRPTA
jgi:hypothetical protein